MMTGVVGGMMSMHVLLLLADQDVWVARNSHPSLRIRDGCDNLEHLISLQTQG